MYVPEYGVGTRGAVVHVCLADLPVHLAHLHEGEDVLDVGDRHLVQVLEDDLATLILAHVNLFSVFRLQKKKVIG